MFPVSPELLNMPPWKFWSLIVLILGALVGLLYLLQ